MKSPLSLLPAVFAALALAAAPARAGSQPQKSLDECYGKPLAVHVTGWAYDPDVSSQSIDVHVYLYTDSGCTSRYGDIRVLTANVPRPDVNQAKGITGDHGFDADIPVADAGDYWVKVFAIDATGDGDPQIGSTRSVTVTERPGYDDEFTVGDLKYTITSSDYEPPTVKVSAANTGISGVVTIPDTVSWWGTDYAVTRIQSFGFQYCTSITGVSIGNNVASIGEAAFYSCDAITEVTVGRGVTSIGDSVFAFCYDLATVTLLPTTPPSIGQDVFENCYDLAEIIVPVSAYDAYVRSWGDYAGLIKDANGTAYSGYCGLDGYHGENLTWSLTDTDGDGVRETLVIDGYGEMSSQYSSSSHAPWYDYRAQITHVVIGGGVTTIRSYAFHNCTALATVTMRPSSPPELYSSALYGCNHLAKIVVPAGTCADYAEQYDWSDYADIIEDENGARARIDLSKLSADYTAHNGDVLTGTTTYNVTVPGGATVTINGVSVTGGGTVNPAPAFAAGGEAVTTKFERGAGDTWAITAFAELGNDALGKDVADEQIKVYAAETVEGLESAAPMSEGVTVTDRKSAVKVSLEVETPPGDGSRFFRVGFGE